MKLLVELAIIFMISLFGEVVSDLLPFAVPASIISLVVLLLLLSVKIIKPKQLDLAGSWILSNMAIFFIPACVSVLEHMNLLLSAWWQILVISLLSFFLTFISAGYTVMGVQKLMERRDRNVSNDNI